MSGLLYGLCSPDFCQAHSHDRPSTGIQIGRSTGIHFGRIAPIRQPSWAAQRPHRVLLGSTPRSKTTGPNPRLPIGRTSWRSLSGFRQVRDMRLRRIRWCWGGGASGCWDSSGRVGRCQTEVKRWVWLGVSMLTSFSQNDNRSLPQPRSLPWKMWMSRSYSRPKYVCHLVRLMITIEEGVDADHEQSRLSEKRHQRGGELSHRNRLSVRSKHTHNLAMIVEVDLTGF
jgi:hypothetical protein